MPDIPQIVLPHGGYRKLIVYRKSETIYQATVLFCRRFLPKFGDRTVDQMTQAARSCKQNIAEGSASSGTSKETEIKLTNVARATLDELLEDYFDYLKAHGAGEWSARDEKKKAAREYAKEHADWADWQKFFKTRDDVTCCNLMIVIIQQTKYLLDQMIRRQEADFKKFGGVRERMHAARTAARGEDWDKGVYSRLDGAASAAELKSRLAEIIRRTRESAATIARRKGWSPLALLSLFSLPHLLPSLSLLSPLSLCSLSLLSLLSFAPLAAMADTEVVDGIEWTYTISGGEASVESGLICQPAIPQSTTGAIIIPSTLGGYPVTSIGEAAFYRCSALTKVVMPSTVKYIGESAFYYCSGLSDIAIHEGIIRIGHDAFYGCSGLENIFIPSSVTDIGSAAFARCLSLECISVEDSNPYFSCGNGILYDKSFGELICFPSGRSEGTIADSVTNIWSSACYYCNKLQALEIPRRVCEMGAFALARCKGLSHIRLPDGLTTIGFSLCEGCENLISVTIPFGVAVVQGFAFAECSKLETVSIPSSVTNIGERAFEDCIVLKTVYVEKGDVARVKGLYDWDSGIAFVEGVIPAPEQEGGFDGSVNHTFNGLVCDADGVMCGMAQITTAKATKKGVKVGGFVMLADGKKQTVKSATVAIVNGQLNVTTKVGKTELTLTITGDGFTGTLGEMTVASADVGEDTGILSGTLKMSYFDAKTGKIKTKSIKLTGVASDGEAIGDLTIKGESAKAFAAEVK